MEYILLNTDIFDNEIGAKFNEIIQTDRNKFDKEKIYKLTVSFHVNLLKDKRFEDFSVPPKPYKRNKVSREEKIGDVLSYQLDKIRKILDENGIEANSTTIQGDDLEAEDIIKIEIYEDVREQKYIGKGKNRRREKFKVSSIVPSKPGTQKLVSELASKRIIEIYRDFMKVIRNDKKLMSGILWMEETNDDKTLIKAFAEQYGELWLTTSERSKELRERLCERALLVFNKCLEEEKLKENATPPEQVLDEINIGK